MKYQYTYRTTGFELWQLSMYYTYSSMVGVCNVIFTAAVLALTGTRWGTAGTAMKLFMILGCCLFPVIQPLAVWLRAQKQAAGIRQDTKVCFDDSGIHIELGEKSSSAGWNTIKRVSKKPTMIIVFSDTTHGFVLTNRVLGEEREVFYAYIASKIKGKET